MVSIPSASPPGSEVLGDVGDLSAALTRSFG
jgi:hypothetical protein